MKKTLKCTKNRHLRVTREVSEFLDCVESKAGKIPPKVILEVITRKGCYFKGTILASEMTPRVLFHELMHYLFDTIHEKTGAILSCLENLMDKVSILLGV